MGEQPDQSQRVWVISELYYPEDTSTGYYLTRVAEGLAAEFSVNVLCAQPTYAARGQRAPKNETRNGVNIRRCWSTRGNKDVLFLRLINFLTITFSIFLQALFRFRRGQRVLVVTNPPLLPFAVAFACRLKSAQCVLLIHDVYPDVLFATGMLKKGSLVARLMDGIFGRLYGSVSRTIVLGRDMEKLVKRKLSAPSSRFSIISHWADTDFIHPRPRRGNRILEEFGLTEKFVVQYSGNMGRTHNLEAVIECARRLRSETDIHFLFVGFGARKAWLQETVKLERLSNVTVADRRPWEELPELLTAVDVAVMSFIPGMSGVSIPSRLYNVLASGSPVIAVADPHSELALTVSEEKVGWVVPAEEPTGLEAAVREAYSQPDELLNMGRRARQVAETRFRYEHIAEAYRYEIRRLGCATSAPSGSGHVPKSRAA